MMIAATKPPFLLIVGSIVLFLNHMYRDSVLQQILKMEWRQIRRFFVFFWKWTEDEYEESSLIQKSFKDCKFFEDTKIFKRKWKIFVDKNFFQAAIWTTFPSSRT